VAELEVGGLLYDSLLTMCNSHVKVNVHACRGDFNWDDPVHTPSWSIYLTNVVPGY
jgi:hypothetical protein